MKKYITLFLALFALPAAALAQMNFISGKTDSSKPIDIQADSLEVLQKEQQAIFKGKVEAKQGNVRIKADEMHVYYREKGGAEDNGVSRIDVVGNVFLATPAETVQGAKGVYDVDKGVITLSDNVVITRGKNVLKGKGLTYNLNTGRSELLSGGGTIGADGKKERVRGYFVPEKQPKN